MAFKWRFKGVPDNKVSHFSALDFSGSVSLLLQITICFSSKKKRDQSDHTLKLYWL